MPTPTPPLDLCDLVPISGLRLSHLDNGITISFNGRTATQTTYNNQTVWYNNNATAESTFVCIRNPYTAGLNASQVKYVKDWAWIWRDNSLNSATKRMQVGVGALVTRELTANTKACFLCGYVRRWGCFDPEVELELADGSRKRARDIAAGDLLWNPVTRTAVEVQMVIEGPEKLGLVELRAGELTLRVSQNHPILTANGLVKAITLRPGDTVYDGFGEPRQLTAVRTVPVVEGQRVINFIVGAESSLTEERMLLSNGIVTGDFTVQTDLRHASEQ